MGIHMQTLFVPYKNAAARAAGLTYLLRDEFTTAAAAPLADPLPMEPGGSLVTQWDVYDTGNKLSKAGGALVWTSATATWNPTLVGTALIDQLPGRALLAEVNYIAQRLQVGFGTVTDASDVAGGTKRKYVVDFNGARMDAVLNGVPASTVAIATGNVYQIAIAVLGAIDVGYWIKGGAFADWTLIFLWPQSPGDITSIIANVGTTSNIGVRYVRVRDLPAPFNVDDGLCVVDVAAPVSGTAYTSVADAISDLAVTAENPLDGDANTRCGLYYRADADLTPAWHVYVDGQGRFRLDGIAADGSRTNYINVAGVIAGGATATLRSIYDSTKHNAYSLAGVTWTRRGGEIDAPLNDDVARIIPEAPAGWTLGALKSLARRSSVYDELDRL